MRVGDLNEDWLTIRVNHPGQIKLVPEGREPRQEYLAPYPANDNPKAWVWLESNGNRIGSPSDLYRLLNRRVKAAGFGEVYLLEPRSERL